LILTSSAGLEFAITDPTGATCGNGTSKQEMFGCVARDNIVTLRLPTAGRYSVLLRKAVAAPFTLTVDAMGATSREATRTFAASINGGELMRTGFTYAAAVPQTISEFEPPALVTSVCSAQSTGRVFDSGVIDDRYEQLRTFAQANKGQPVAFVVTDADLAAAGKESVPSDVPATVQDLSATIDAAGVHLSGKATASVVTLSAATDISVGVVDGKIAVRIRSLTASPLPDSLLDGVRAALEKSFDEFSVSFPFTVRQVAMRQGCLAVMGTTP
jgi:hypothetical protein